MTYEKLTRAGLVGALALLGAVGLAGGAGAADIEVAAGMVEVAEDGQCSLIEALENANGDAEHDDCMAGDDGLDTVLPASGSVYTLTVAHNVVEDPSSSPCLGLSQNGLPVITSPVTVRGQGATIERSKAVGTPEFRMFQIEASGELTVERLTLRHGRALLRSDGTGTHGGAICNAGGELRVRDSVLSDNSAAGNGGGIDNTGVATVSGSTLSDNSTGGRGGGIRNTGTLTMDNSTLTHLLQSSERSNSFEMGSELA